MYYFEFMELLQCFDQFPSTEDNFGTKAEFPTGQIPWLAANQQQKFT